MMGTVYLIHLDRPVGQPDPDRKARGRKPRKRPFISKSQHYLGWTNDLDHRLNQHFTSRGSSFLAFALQCGVGMRLVKTWSGIRHLEAKMKRLKNNRRLCPVCKGGSEMKSGIKDEELQELINHTDHEEVWRMVEHLSKSVWQHHFQLGEVLITARTSGTSDPRLSKAIEALHGRLATMASRLIDKIKRYEKARVAKIKEKQAKGLPIDPDTLFS